MSAPLAEPTWMGKSLSSLSREELEDALIQLAELNKNLLEMKEHEAKLLQELRKRK